MSLMVVGGFVAGAAVAAVALPTAHWVRRMIARRGTSAALAENSVSSVSQVLHLAIQGAPTGIVVVDHSGEVLLSNYRAHELGIVHERHLNEQIWDRATAVFHNRQTLTLDLNVPRRRAGSRVMAVQAVVKPLTLIDDRFIIIYCADQSENVRMEAARRDFVANVSHELKTPVGAMALLAEALTSSADDPDSVEYFGERINAEAHRMGDMISELIALSKLQGAERLPDMKAVAIDEVIDKAIGRNQLAAETAGISLTRGARSGVEVRGDEQLLLTALSNLISNAINYSPAATPVTITQKIVGQDTVHIKVTDRGIGIAPEHQQRVFERFFRVDKARSRSTGGTGLGLAIVKHVAANHGGAITVWSRLGTGSTFTLELPIMKADEPAQDPVPAPAAALGAALPTGRSERR